MNTSTIIATGGLIIFSLMSIAPSTAQKPPEEFCDFEFSISGSKADVEQFGASFRKSPWYEKSECQPIPFEKSRSASSLKQPSGDRVVGVYICLKPIDKVVTAATDSYLYVLNTLHDEGKKKVGSSTDDLLRLASIDPHIQLAQGTELPNLGVSANACACGTSGPCSGGYIGCSRIHPTCPPC